LKQQHLLTYLRTLGWKIRPAPGTY